MELESRMQEEGEHIKIVSDVALRFALRFSAEQTLKEDNFQEAIEDTKRCLRRRTT